MKDPVIKHYKCYSCSTHWGKIRWTEEDGWEPLSGVDLDSVPQLYLGLCKKCSAPKVTKKKTKLKLFKIS